VERRVYKMKRKYYSLGKTSLQNSIAYRSSFITNMCASLFFAISLFYLWKTIYTGKSLIAGYSWDEMKAYLLITFISNTLLSWYSETAISKKILDGSVAMDLLKPLDFQKSRLAETLGTGLFESLIGIVMACIILVLYTGIMTPSSPYIWLLFLISMSASVFIKFGVIYIAGLCCFWTSNPFGIAVARAAITNLFSGALIPLTFFPGWLKNLALSLPFKGIVYTPASLYLGRISGTAALREITIQIFWAVLLWFLGKLVWNSAVKQVTIYGG
jgi:ABC-2 type transport system permease protein